MPKQGMGELIKRRCRLAWPLWYEHGWAWAKIGRHLGVNPTNLNNRSWNWARWFQFPIREGEVVLGNGWTALVDNSFLKQRWERLS